MVSIANITNKLFCSVKYFKARPAAVVERYYNCVSTFSPKPQKCRDFFAPKVPFSCFLLWATCSFVYYSWPSSFLISFSFSLFFSPLSSLCCSLNKEIMLSLSIISPFMYSYIVFLHKAFDNNYCLSF